MSYLHERLDVYLNEVFLQTIFSKYSDTEYVLLLIPAALILIVTWLFLVYSLRAQAVNTPDYIMEMDKPVYISKSRWIGIIEKARFHRLAQEEFPSYASYVNLYDLSDRKIDY